MTKPPKNVLDLPIELRAEMAFKIAVEKAIIRHVRAGVPMYIWRDGKVVAIPPEELRVEAARLQAE